MMATAKQPKAITSYVHRDKPCGDRWLPGYFAAYCEARNQAIHFGRRGDNLYGHYLHGEYDDATDAVLVQAAEWNDRLAWAHWREAVLLWNEGES